MLMPETVADVGVARPRRSRCRSTDWFAPSAVSVVEPEQLAMPGAAGSSVHEKLTPTSVLFQPFAFAAGVRLPTIVGLVLSIMTLTECAQLDVAGEVDAPELEDGLAFRADGDARSGLR